MKIVFSFMYKPERTRTFTLTIMNIRILPQMFPCALLLMMTTSTMTMTEMRGELETKSTPRTPLKSWFREKYLQNSYDEYYHYTLTRYKLEDNDYDVCPDIHKSSIYFAITGQNMNRIKKTCSVFYVKKSTIMNSDSDNYYTSPNTTIYNEMPDTLLTITNILGIFSMVACYTFEISMLIMSVILASCSTLFMFMLLFCQY